MSLETTSESEVSINESTERIENAADFEKIIAEFGTDHPAVKAFAKKHNLDLPSIGPQFKTSVPKTTENGKETVDNLSKAA
ncbi:MAG: hypothetical protein A3B03_00155 [Candidatus Zambryskibacteria bacterium RIFCSPLOWO2_01_FULL_42_41]|nr:MAG: hypothetical protein A2829_02390 [Candidatus Zambryskibacteria bacterium RIFCSPHIGHO2_01_FULL_43_60]OHB02815.1 MAG: hypothetical protein A3B03_00155 [Candidatus Zambryskibacteria bacterium RIFCSPLOWO2_01_FULL_42_41]